jgi:DNA-directed RNA polymerase subunit RPC12/RpoP
MEKATSLMKTSIDSYQLEGKLAYFKCKRCGEEFQKPLLATVSSAANAQKYFACPRCLTKFDIVKESKTEEKREAQPAAKERAKAASKLEEARCSHFLGYLKKRPKNTPIPDDCLTCDKMIECLTL